MVSIDTFRSKFEKWNSSRGKKDYNNDIGGRQIDEWKMYIISDSGSVLLRWALFDLMISFAFEIFIILSLARATGLLFGHMIT